MKRTSIIIVLVSTFFLSFCPLAKGQKEMKILCYNTEYGMMADTSYRKRDFVEFIKQQNPDIVGLQEMNGYTQRRLERLAKDYGHPYAMQLKEDGFPTALTSKHPIVNVKRVLDYMHHGYLMAQTNGYNIIVLHLSPFDWVKRNQEIDAILQVIASSPSQERWIIMGDFNSVSPFDKAMHIGSKLQERMVGWAKARPTLNNLRDGKIDYEVHEKILKFGFVDPVRIITPKEEGKGTRIDYIYVTKDLKENIVDAKFIRNDFTKTHSDHTPLYLILKEIEKK